MSDSPNYPALERAAEYFRQWGRRKPNPRTTGPGTGPPPPPMQYETSNTVIGAGVAAMKQDRQAARAKPEEERWQIFNPKMYEDRDDMVLYLTKKENFSEEEARRLAVMAFGAEE